MTPADSLVSHHQSQCVTTIALYINLFVVLRPEQQININSTGKAKV